MRKVIYNGENFIVDYDEASNKIRISYFEDGHFVDEVEFDFIPPRCVDCKYLGENCNCTHPDASYCRHGELRWPQEKEKVDK